MALDARRADGVFFTGQALASRAARLLRGSLGADACIVDPACGAGDLLLACAPLLPAQPSLSLTIDAWSRQLQGVDIHAEFVRAARIRLALRASTFFPSTRASPQDDGRFLGIAVGSGRESRALLSRATHIITNPPYGLTQASAETPWGTGRVTEAALFVDECILAASPGTHVVAILPDVLRSGSRYEKWRRAIATRAEILHCKPYGLFDTAADVDVFVLHLLAADIPRKARVRWLPSSPGAGVGRKLSAHFIVNVGPVVDYRDPHRGKYHPYACAKTTPAWREVSDLPRRRRFDSARLVQPPFVVVRRTSRPGDAYRATATIIRGTRAVAVDNHLLVLKPRDKTLATCRAALRLLRTPATSNWLNLRIRCRHLTVGALSELPWNRAT